jgi:metal-sulfur cluster biosynthetic enzyme
MVDGQSSVTGQASVSAIDWLVDGPDADAMRELLRTVTDPELGVNIVDLGLVYELDVSSDGIAQVRMTLTTPGCPLGAYLDDAVRDALAGLPGIVDLDLRVVWDPPWSPAMMTDAAKAALGWRR